MRTNVYVDAFNLYYGCLKGTPYRWLDLAALCRRLLPNDEINRIRYFTALVSARPDDPQEPQRQLTYLRALRTIPNLSIHTGHYLSHSVRMRLANPPPGGPATVEVIKTEEKSSDVKEPIAVVQRDLGLIVGIVNPHPPKRRSRALQPTFFKQIRESALRTCQFPLVLTDADGKIHKPARW